MEKQSNSLSLLQIQIQNLKSLGITYTAIGVLSNLHRSTISKFAHNKIALSVEKELRLQATIENILGGIGNVARNDNGE